ncbi:hypothetical protein [Absidia glauca]|uniref:Uncharacterized protein n=1 Tax=Absidia glauca TaxID=4829 RepID=A0A163M6G0_ABSGL|nr:hypothetical protein [Absidia glauca]
MTLTMEPSSLELLLLHETILFKERSIDLVVAARKAYCSSNDNNGLFLLEIFDGTSSMFGFLLGGSHPFCSQHSRTHLETLQKSELTELYIESARVCLYRQGADLRPILHISRYSTKQIPTASLFQKSNPIEDMPQIKEWLMDLEKHDQETFLSMVAQGEITIPDAFWKYYLQQLEPTLEGLVSAYRIAKLSPTTPPSQTDTFLRHRTSSLSSLGASSFSSTSSRSLSSSRFPPSPRHKLKTSERVYDTLTTLYPTMTWQNIQTLINDTFSTDNDHVMDGYLAIPHTICSNIVVEPHEEKAQSQPALQVDMDDWWILYMEINALPTQADQIKTLTANKMKSMMATVDIALD